MTAMFLGIKQVRCCAFYMDNYLSGLGAESQAVVEFAPYPKIPSEKRKPDNRNATIENGMAFIWPNIFFGLSKA